MSPRQQRIAALYQMIQWVKGRLEDCSDADDYEADDYEAIALIIRQELQRLQKRRVRLQELREAPE